MREPLELTSRVSTDAVAEAKEKLAIASSDLGGVDVAMATNMISVGLDIGRLGLMLVRDPRFAEFELFSNGRRLIGENAPHARLHAETLDRRVWDADDDPLLGGIGSLVAGASPPGGLLPLQVHPLEPSVLATDDLEDVGLAVDGAPLGRSPTWPPAVEMFSEGIFRTFDPTALQSWLSSPATLARAKTLSEGASA